jgi:TPP-dependent pyruvate/acetoin dehydrogenase alpha subunit
MVLSRRLDDLGTKLQRMGRIGLYSPVHGQEAAVVGSALALDPKRDWMVPASREQPAWLRHGLPLRSLFASYMGRLDEARIPDGLRLLPRQQSIGTQLPHAAGIAWAVKLRREPGIVLVYCGDGASSEGDFHEACNLAGVMRLPLVIVLINNAYAISTPVAKQTAGSLAARAAGYGFRGRVIDGNDLFAVYDATREAVARARQGGGPTLLECQTYRMSFHNTSDNPKEYRADSEVAEAATRDPIARVRTYVVAAGLATEDELDAVQRDTATELERIQKEVAGVPRPGREAIFEHVYDRLPERVRRQRDGDEPGFQQSV